MKTEFLTTLKRHASRVLSELRDSGEPVLITEHGQPAAYLVNVEVFESMQRKMEVLEGIARGERALLEQRVMTNDEARARMTKWLG